MLCLCRACKESLQPWAHPHVSLWSLCTICKCDLLCIVISVNCERNWKLWENHQNHLPHENKHEAWSPHILCEIHSLFKNPKWTDFIKQIHNIEWFIHLMFCFLLQICNLFISLLIKKDYTYIFKCILSNKIMNFSVSLRQDCRHQKEVICQIKSSFSG